MPKKLKKNDGSRKIKKPRNFFRYVFFLAIVFILAGTFIHYRTKQLEKVVESKFNVARRWNIPSRVYSDTEYIFPGVSVKERGLKEKLIRLGYKEQRTKLQGPGDFFWSKDHIDIHLHDFAYPQEKFSGFPIRIELNGENVNHLSDLESNDVLSLVRIEPEEIATLFDEKMEDRTVITLRDCPQHLLEAVILIEDERFFVHKGVDPVAIARAAVADILSLSLAQGGSTLTQQLVKNFFLTSKKSLGRKIEEAMMALIIEKKYSKREILETYLNEIYLGQRGPSSVTGVAEAAKHYFGKEINQLTLAESALLAGMIRYPARYSPLRSKQSAKERRDFILARMLKANIIDEASYAKAVDEEIVTPKPKFKPVQAPFFIDFLKQQLADLYPEEILETEGLKIFTTLDMTMQLRAQESLVKGLADLEKNFSHLLPKDKRGQLQGCLIAMSPQNGYVRAMVGGKDYQESQFNRCTQALRQPGSTFKPFVFLTAFDPSRSLKLQTPASLIEDKSFTIQTPLGPWSPQNYDNKEHGIVTARKTLEMSYNIATAKLGIDVGLDAIVQTARDAGISSPLSPFPSLSLGAFEVTPLELISAYTVFPNRGVRAEALAVINVMTPKGEALEKKTLKIKKVFDEAPIALVTNLMKGVFDRGTAHPARSMGFRAVSAGKTGTTSNFRDAWFVGFTPQLLSLTWVGFDDNNSIKMSGARAALPIWVDFMKKEVGDTTQDFPFPQGIVEVKIDPDTGAKWTSDCPKTFQEYFIKGTEPKEFCSHGSQEDVKPEAPKEETTHSGEEYPDSQDF